MERLNTGIVDLHDFFSRHAWHEPRLPRLLKQADLPLLATETSSFHPPPQLIVVCHALETDHLVRFLPWLSSAESLHVVLDCRDTAIDEDMRDFIESEIRETLAPAQLASILHLESEHTLGHLRRLLAMAVQTKSPEEHEPRVVPSPHPPGPWLSVHRDSFRSADEQLPRLACTREGMPAL